MGCRERIPPTLLSAALQISPCPGGGGTRGHGLSLAQQRDLITAQAVCLITSWMILRWKEQGSTPALCTALRAPPSDPATATTAEGTQQLTYTSSSFTAPFLGVISQAIKGSLWWERAEPRMGTAVCPVPTVMPCTIPGASTPTQPGQHQKMDGREESLIHGSTTLGHTPLLRAGPVPINAVLTPPELPNPSYTLPHCAEADFVFSC